MRGWVRGIAFASILVAIWAAGFELAKTPLLPGPADVARSIVAAVRDGSLVLAVLTSAVRLAVGYAIAMAAGVPLGVALARSALVKQSVGPLVLGLSAV